MGTEGNINRVVSQKQTGALKILEGIERERSIRKCSRTRPGHRRGQRDRTIEPFCSAGQIERVEIKDGSTALKDVGDHVEDPSLEIDDAGAQDADFIADIAILAEKQGGGNGRPQVDM